MNNQVTIVVSDNNGFIINVTGQSAVDHKGTLHNIPYTKSFVATTLDEAMIIARENIEALMV